LFTKTIFKKLVGQTEKLKPYAQDFIPCQGRSPSARDLAKEQKFWLLARYIFRFTYLFLKYI